MQQQLPPSVEPARFSFASIREPDSTAAVQEIVREAIAINCPLEPFGGGTQVEIGYKPDRPLIPVCINGLRSLVEYDPDNFVVVVEAGMTFAPVQAILAEHGQTLPFEPAFPERQTLGGIVATRAESLIRGGKGAVRDWLIGCEAVGGEGQLIVGNGKRVKETVGYDLSKLYCGSWGTLGILTKVAFQTAPLPAAKTTLLIPLKAERNSEEALDALNQAVPVVTFAYLLNPQVAVVLLGPDTPAAQYLVIGIDGYPEASSAQSRRVQEALTPHTPQIIDLPDAIAARLRSGLRDLPGDEDAPLSVQCNILPSQVGAFVRMLEWTARRYGFTALVLADAQSGIIWSRISAPPSNGEGIDSDLEDRWMRLYPDLRDKLDRVGGASVLRRMPNCWRKADYPIWSPVLADATYMRRIKNVFDPHAIFRPGRYFDHI